MGSGASSVGSGAGSGTAVGQVSRAPRWQVIGKKDGTVLVRERKSYASEEIGHLMKGAVLEEICMEQTKDGHDRLQYKLISGTGPRTGWVNIRSNATGRTWIERISSGTYKSDEDMAKRYGTELFHQTDEETAEIILSSQEMKPGSKGLAGGGIYFATSEELTGHKAHAHGVILRAYVHLGKILTLDADGDTKMTRNKLQRLGYDSVCIARKVSSGQEYVVYDSDQVRYIERA